MKPKPDLKRALQRSGIDEFGDRRACHGRLDPEVVADIELGRDPERGGRARDQATHRVGLGGCGYGRDRGGQHALGNVV